MTSRCPICRKVLNPTPQACGLTAYYPFCSNRCKLVDLHAWLKADYRIDAPSDIEEQEEWPADLA